MEIDSIFNTEDLNLVETQSFDLKQVQNIFHFDKSDIPGFEHLIASQNPQIPHTVYLGYETNPNPLYLPYKGNPQPLNQEGRRFIDMISNQQIGINVRVIQLVKAVREHFQFCQNDYNTSQSESESFTEMEIGTIVMLYNKIIQEVYGFIPKCFSHFLDSLKQEKLDNYEQLSQFCQNYINFNIIDAENIIYKQLVKLIDDKDIILIQNESQIIFRALIVAAQTKKFTLILTQKICKETKQFFEKHPNITVQQYEIYKIPFNLVTKLFFNCFELSTTGNALTFSSLEYSTLLATLNKKPTFVVCEKFKFSNQILLDSTLVNVVSEGNKLDLIFGIVDHSNITGVVCEFGIIGIDGFSSFGI